MNWKDMANTIYVSIVYVFNWWSRLHKEVSRNTFFVGEQRVPKEEKRIASKNLLYLINLSHSFFSFGSLARWLGCWHDLCLPELQRRIALVIWDKQLSSVAFGGPSSISLWVLSITFLLLTSFPIIVVLWMQIRSMKSLGFQITELWKSVLAVYGWTLLLPLRV